MIFKYQISAKEIHRLKKDLKYLKFRALCASNSRTNEGKERTEKKKINYLTPTVTLLHIFDCLQATGAFKDRI